MKKNLKQNEAGLVLRKVEGFTLIEMIFYVLFISIIVGGSFGIIHQLLRNSENLKTGISIEEESNFILKKISWVLNDQLTISLPVQGGPVSDTLWVYKNDFGSSNPVEIRLNSGIIEVRRGAGGYKQLSNDRFTVQNLEFRREWDGSNPDTDIIYVSFEIDGQPFSMSRKIR